jgi:hypothetical protein
MRACAGQFPQRSASQTRFARDPTSLLARRASSAHRIAFLRSGRPSIGALAFAAAISLAPAPARAAPPEGPPADRLATARELFAQAEHDEDAGRWQDALDTLRQIALVKLTAGIRYHIALCEERLDLLANAFEDFLGAREQATLEQAQDVLRLVGAELESLEPRVPRLSIHVSPEGLDAAVTLDGQALDVSRMGDSRPLNPGAHTIEARANGRRPTRVVVTMHERDATALEIPLAELSTPAPATSLAPARPQGETAPASANAGWPPVRVGAIVATVAAAALAGGGVGAYLAAGRAHDDAVPSCATVVDRSPGACDAQKNTVHAWDWAAAGAWAGAAISAGLAVYFWTRPARADVAAAQVQLLVGTGSFAIRGSF